jgi:hypothetical protein
MSFDLTSFLAAAVGQIPDAGEQVMVSHLQLFRFHTHFLIRPVQTVSLKKLMEQVCFCLRASDFGSLEMLGVMNAAFEGGV